MAGGWTILVAHASAEHPLAFQSELSLMPRAPSLPQKVFARRKAEFFELGFSISTYVSIALAGDLEHLGIASIPGLCSIMSKAVF